MRLLLLVLAVSAATCAAPLADDGSSVSVGTHVEGALRRSSYLPLEGDGYVIMPPWRERRSNYGTEETVGLVVRSTRQVARRLRGGTAAIGDLSRLGGGTSPEHRSHSSGRDVDVFFYAVDSSGKPVRPNPARGNPGGMMPRFGPDGRSSTNAERASGVRFDVRRNWALIRAMLTDPDVEVQWIFIHRALASLLLAEAARTESPALVARAGEVFHQPTDALPHDDHMHVRIYCDPADRFLGCADRGPERSWRKQGRFVGREGEGIEVSPHPVLDALMRVLRTEAPRGWLRPPLRS